MIEEHTLFHKLYPDISIIPKIHYMVHYPSQMMQFGPLIHTWTMRHEAMLSIIKRASHGNFKNVSLTVAKRHQHLLCYHLNCGLSFLARDAEVSTTGYTNDLSSELVDFQSVSICWSNHSTSKMGAVNKEVPLGVEEPMNFAIAASIYEINKFLGFVYLHCQTHPGNP